MARAGRPNKSDPRFSNVPFLIKTKDNGEVKKILAEIGINAGDGSLRSALIWATSYKNNDLLTWLIDNKADVDQQDKNGYSALHFAALGKNEEAAKLLLDAGAKINVTDVHGNTPLWTAVFNSKGDYSLVRLYIQKGANLDIVNNYERTPRQLAETIAGFDLETIK